MTGPQALADLRLRVAIDLAPTLDNYLADTDDIMAVINDAADCWQALPPHLRAHYEAQQFQHPVNRFLGDYVTEVDTRAQDEMDAWRHHANRLRGQPAPPPADALTIGAGPTPAVRALIVYHNARIRDALHT